jgi:hypothetical protein
MGETNGSKLCLTLTLLTRPATEALSLLENRKNDEEY